MEVVVGETDWLPLVALVPLQALLAVQVVALVLVQVRVELAPLVILVGAADRFSVGGMALVVTLRLGLDLGLSLAGVALSMAETV